MTTVSNIDIMGMPSWSSHFESSAPHLRLNTVAATTDISSSEVAQSRESSGEIGDNHENTSATAFPAQGDHRTPLRTVRKKKSSYDLRDEFRHPEPPAPGSVISTGQDLRNVIQRPSSRKALSRTANDQTTQSE
ncbi:hypothetical protein PILCRDRAFT_812211 [Piloderma croceum F 1598]|uniref:Uncharacterized protein n=1 Tax=Piloderma croceum (strain F 1598) TaxID=765440 RepID=A0A0C3GIJ0_PILCF|nr:hypothetical protein PILCRDRAFT_812211 [Piloderma croceum F 1598]